MDSLQEFKKPWAHEHEPIKELVDAVKVHSIHLSSEEHWKQVTLLSRFKN